MDSLKSGWSVFVVEDCFLKALEFTVYILDTKTEKENGQYRTHDYIMNMFGMYGHHLMIPWNPSYIEHTLIFCVKIKTKN